MLLQACKTLLIFQARHHILRRRLQKLPKKHVLRVGKLNGNSCLAQGIASFRAAVTPRCRINRYFGAVKPGYAVLPVQSVPKSFSPANLLKQLRSFSAAASARSIIFRPAQPKYNVQRLLKPSANNWGL